MITDYIQTISSHEKGTCLAEQNRKEQNTRALPLVFNSHNYRNGCIQHINHIEDRHVFLLF